MHWTKIGLGAAVALSLTWASPSAVAVGCAPLGERLVDVLGQPFGQRPGVRAIHAQGEVVEGSFTPKR